MFGSLRTRIAAFRNATKSVNENAIIVPLYRVATGEYQPESVASAIEAYLHDTDIFNAVNFISNALSLTASTSLEMKIYKEGKVVDLVEEFNQSIRWEIDGERKRPTRITQNCNEGASLYGGNTFIEMLASDRLLMLNQVELSSIYKIYRNEAGDISKIQQLIGGRLNPTFRPSIDRQYLCRFQRKGVIFL